MIKGTTLAMGLCHSPFAICISLKQSNLNETKKKKLRHFYKGKKINLSRWGSLQWERTLKFPFIEVFYSRHQHFSPRLTKAKR